MSSDPKFSKNATMLCQDRLTSASLQIATLMVDCKVCQHNRCDSKNLTKMGEDIRKLSDQFIDDLQHILASFLQQEDLQQQMIKAFTGVRSAMTSLIAACKTLGVASSKSVTCTSLIKHANQLQEVLKELVMLVWRTRLTVVSQQEKSVREALEYFLSASNLDSLSDMATKYTEAIAGLEQLFQNENLLFCETVDFSKVNAVVDVLRSSVPMLSSSMESCLKYPDVEDAKLSQSVVIGLAITSLDSLMEALMGTAPRLYTSLINDDDITPVSVVISRIIDGLNLDVSTQEMVQMAALVDSVIRFTLDVVELTNKDSQTALLQACKEVLSDYSETVQHCRFLQNPSVVKDSHSEVQISVQRMIDSMRTLQSIITSSLQNVVAGVMMRDNTLEAIEMQHAFQIQDSNCDGRESKNSLDRQSHTVDFKSHSKNFCQMLRIAIVGSCGNLTDIQEIHRKMCTVETLGKQMILCAEKILTGRDHAKEQPQMEQLRGFCEEWCTCVEKLLCDVSELFDCNPMLIICGAILVKRLSGHDHFTSITHEMLDNSTALIAWRFVSLVKRVTDRILDTSLKRGVRRKGFALEQGLMSSSADIDKQHRSNFRSKCVFDFLQHSICDICWCVKNAKLTDDQLEESGDIVNEAFDKLVRRAMTQSNFPSDQSKIDVNFNSLTGFALHDSAASEIKEIMSRLIFDAVSGSSEANAAAQELLVMSTHLLQSSLLLMDAGKQKNSSLLLEKTSEVSSLVPMIFEEVQKVQRSAEYDLDRLYEYGEKCCHAMCFLVDYVDGILYRWNPVPKNCIRECLDGDHLSFESEIRRFELQTVELDALFGMVNEETLAFDSDVRMLTGRESLKSFVEDIDRLSHKILSLANRSSSGEKVLVYQMRCLMKDWSARVYFLVNRLGGVDLYDFASLESWKNQLLQKRQFLDKLREIMPIHNGQQEIFKIYEQLKEILLQMEDLAAASDQLFISQKLKLLLSEWNLKVKRLENFGQNKNVSQKVEIELDEPDLSKAQQTSGKSTAKERRPTKDGCSTDATTVQTATMTQQVSDLKVLPRQESMLQLNSTRNPTIDPTTTDGQTHVKCRLDGTNIRASIIDSVEETSLAVHLLEEYLQNMTEGYQKDEVEELLNNIQVKAREMKEVAHILTTLCLDERIGSELKIALQYMQSILSQLFILISVKMAVNNRFSNDANIKTSIQRLLGSLANIESNFSAACIKGLKQSSSDTNNEKEIQASANQWKLNWIQKHTSNNLQSDKDKLGLRTTAALPQYSLLHLSQKRKSNLNVKE